MQLRIGCLLADLPAPPLFCMHTTQWLTAQTAVYEGTDFGDSVAAVDALLETFASSKRQLDAHKTTVSAMESEQEVITSRRAEVLAAVEATEAKAAEYEGSLNQSREYYEHLMASNKAFNSKVGTVPLVVAS